MMGENELVAVFDADRHVLKLTPSLQELPTLVDALPTFLSHLRAGEPLWFDVTSGNGRRLPWLLELRRLAAPANPTWPPGCTQCEIRPNGFAAWPRWLPLLLPGWLHDLLQPVSAISNYASAGARVAQPNRAVSAAEFVSMGEWFAAIRVSIEHVSHEIAQWRAFLQGAAQSLELDLTVKQRIECALRILAFPLRNFDLSCQPKMMLDLGTEPAKLDADWLSHYDAATLSLTAFLCQAVTPEPDQVCTSRAVRAQLFLEINETGGWVRRLTRPRSTRDEMTSELWWAKSIPLPLAEWVRAERQWNFAAAPTREQRPCRE